MTVSDLYNFCDNLNCDTVFYICRHRKVLCSRPLFAVPMHYRDEDIAYFKIDTERNTCTITLPAKRNQVI